MEIKMSNGLILGIQHCNFEERENKYVIWFAQNYNVVLRHSSRPTGPL